MEERGWAKPPEVEAGTLLGLGCSGCRRGWPAPPISLGAHPLALWSRRAWNSNWSWSALEEVKESRDEGPGRRAPPEAPPNTCTRVKSQA